MLGVLVSLVFLQAQAIARWQQHEAGLVHPGCQPAQERQVGLDRRGCQPLSLPHLHHCVQVLLPQVARIRHGVEASFQLEVEKKTPQEAGALGAGLVRDGFLARRVPGVEQLDQCLQHAHGIGMAGPKPGEDFLGRLVCPGLATWPIRAGDAPPADGVGRLSGRVRHGALHIKRDGTPPERRTGRNPGRPTPATDSVSVWRGRSIHHGGARDHDMRHRPRGCASHMRVQWSARSVLKMKTCDPAPHMHFCNDGGW